MNNLSVMRVVKIEALQIRHTASGYYRDFEFTDEKGDTFQVTAMSPNGAGAETLNVEIH